MFMLGPQLAQQREGPLAVTASRHLFLQFNNNAATEPLLLFLLANQAQRHGACRVTARKSGRILFKFGQLVRDPPFLEGLAQAKDNASVAAEVTEKLMPFLSVPGAQIPFGPV